MIQRAVAQFAATPECEAVHLPYHFTPEAATARAASVAKVIELVRVIARLFRIRLGGPIDLLLCAPGGPQTVPIIRDLLLLPWALLFSRRLVLHFHAAGISDRFPPGSRHPFALLLRQIYRRARAAIVMTNFNRRDPERFGIEQVLVVSHRIRDEYDPALLRRSDRGVTRLLYVGHLCPDKGTPDLLAAFASLWREDPRLRLELVGECLPPWQNSDLERLVDQLGIRAAVHLAGVRSGRAKLEAFAGADLFVFPSIAPYESFGLVVVEAMMWGLPVVLTEWRGNIEVLTAEGGGVRVPVTAPLSSALEDGLREALRHRDDWEAWGQTNRAIFATRYREMPGDQWLARACLGLLEPATA